MKLPRWLRGHRRYVASRHAAGDRRRRFRTLEFESLEGRRLLALTHIIDVTTDSDASTHTGVSLRDAIAAANADAKNGQSATIVFDSSINGLPITLVQGDLELGAGGTGSGAITIDGGNQMTVNGNHTSGVFLVDASVTATISGLTITGGNATDGGGINNAGTLTISSSTVTGNSAGSGGGIYNDGLLTIVGSTVSVNTAASQYGGGGGIENYEGALTLSNSTVSGNVANGANAFGGGIQNFFGVMEISNSTIACNSASGQYGTSGGIENDAYASPAQMVMVNTIVAKNTAHTAPDFGGMPLAAGSTNDLIGIDSGYSGLTNGSDDNQVGSAGDSVDPLLGSLANYGGATQTMALRSTSSAVNAGGAVTTLASSVNGSDTTFSVSVLTNFALIASTPGSYVIQIDSEQIQITGYNTSTQMVTVVRGYNQTTATGHNAGAAVMLPYDQIGDSRVGIADIGAYEFHGMPASIGNFGSTVNYTAQGPAVALAAAATVTAGGNGLANSKLTVSIGTSGSYDVATIAVGNGVTISNSALSYSGKVIGYFAASSGASPLVVQFTSVATAAAVQAVIDDVVFSNTYAGTWIYDRTASFQLTDANNVISAATTEMIHFIAAAPVVSNLGSAASYTAGSGPTVVAGSATVSGANDLQNSKLVVSLGNAGMTDALVISAGSGITVNGNQVLYNGTLIGWYSVGSGSTPLVVQFNRAASVAAVQAVVDDIAYYNTNAGMSVYDRTIDFSLTDGFGNSSSLASKTVHVSDPTP